MQLRLRAAASFFAVSLCCSAQAAETPAEALSWEAVYKGDVWVGLKGRMRDHDAYVGLVELKLTVDGGATFQAPGNVWFVHVQNTHGSRPNGRLNTVQGIDNNEVDTHTTKVLEAWYEKRWSDVSIKAGLYDLNTEFYATESSGLFLHPSFGIGPEMAQTGANGPSIFPTTSLAARVAVGAETGVYVLFAALDAVPGDPERSTGTHIDVSGKEGLLYVGEAGVRDETHKIGFGVWRYSHRAEVLDAGSSAEKRPDRGAYALWERIAMRAETATLHVFFRVGIADSSINVLSSGFTAGVSGHGWHAARPRDSFAVGVAGARYGGRYRSLEGDDAPDREMAYELTYRFEFRRFALQPTLMFVDRGVTGEGEDVLAGLRLEATI